MGMVLVKEYIKKYGKEKSVNVLCEALNRKMIKPEEISIRDLYESIYGRLPSIGVKGLIINDIKEAAVNTYAFRYVTGTMFSMKVLEGWEEIPTVGDSLVTTVPTTDTKIYKAGFTGIESTELPLVKEGTTYPTTTLGEKYIAGEVYKYGEIIEITEEMIRADKTGTLLEQAKMLGMIARKTKENHILRAVTALIDSYKPNGVTTSIFSESGSFINAISGNALKDYKSVDSVLQVYAAMKSDNGNLMKFTPDTIFVPYSLFQTAQFISGVTVVSYDPNTALGTAKIVSQGKSPLPIPAPLTSLALADLGAPSGTSVSTNWYMGAPKRAFEYNEYYPIQVVSLANGGEMGYYSDTTFSFKVRLSGGVVTQNRTNWVRSRP